MCRQKKFDIAIFSLLSFLILSCSNSTGSLISDYNNTFFSYDDMEAEKNKFNPENMLLPFYEVASNASLNIPAPEKATSYEWKMTRVDGENITTVYFTNTREFKIYIPDYKDKIKEDTTYGLQLKIVADGQTYRDNCYVFVYNPDQILKQ